MVMENSGATAVRQVATVIYVLANSAPCRASTWAPLPPWELHRRVDLHHHRGAEPAQVLN